MRYAALTPHGREVDGGQFKVAAEALAGKGSVDVVSGGEAHAEL